MVAAFKGSECFGFINAHTFPFNQESIYPLMIYGDDIRALEFKAYHIPTKNYYQIDEMITYVPDMHLGDGFNPVNMNFRAHDMIYKIDNPYPNPFNPVVNFDISLSAESTVDVKIYNIAGQEITTVYKGQLSGITHKMSWNASNYANGIYFIKILIGDEKPIIKKIILLK